MDWPITEVARRAGTTSRALRHYDDIGLLAPSRIGSNGYRYYDRDALVRLQRIRLLRDLGLGLPDIARVLAGERDDANALTVHLAELERERQRIAAQMASVRATIAALRNGRSIMAEEMFDGFDHTTHRQEVEERWGGAAAERSNAWWSSLTTGDRDAFQREQREIQAAFDALQDVGAAPDSAAAQDVAERQVRWITAGWGGERPGVEAIRGLGDLYVDDARFAQHYTARHADGAAYVRDAMHAYADRHDTAR